ncbi:DsbE family thiol:disulfide interchange protein [uncultured Roseovarius sp.]|uniref:DsbE family thiol:disulfide interchange protein n=1 Tax=uncultured Roseovarius sp. TaxID=293344 RepID=UPI0025D111BE|nr:DsbE family thiol:disulfide interchange protein [uncultured Roseovarius sp.]
MAKISPLMIAPPAIFAGLAALFFFGMQRENPDELPSAMTGKPAPAVQVTPLGDKTPFTDAELRSEGVKLLNYWASWCAPCRVEHPILEDLADQGITIYGVNYKDKPGNALRFLDELGDPYTAIGADESGRMALDWGVYGVPETYVIDGKGNIVLRFAGPITERVLESQIMPAIAEAKAAQ